MEKAKMGHAMEDFIVAKYKKVGDTELGLYVIFDGHSEKAIKEAYPVTDGGAGGVAWQGKGGSIAVTAFLIDGQKLAVANVGDSRAIICQDGVARQLSVDREGAAEDREERGIATKQSGNVPQVYGQLATSRAFGDARLKEHISSEADATVGMIDKETEFIMLASDGLWKVMSNQEAVDAIRGMDDGGEAAHQLSLEALSRKSADDASCIVVVFN